MTRTCGPDTLFNGLVQADVLRAIDRAETRAAEIREGNGDRRERSGSS
ncbi:MAG: hypothetical protein U0575_13725 [Phycisphaerales bacterium]